MSDVVDRFVVVLDANVLYPFVVRDVLLRFAEAGLYRARWSNEILDEMVRSILKKKPGHEDSIKRTRKAMVAAFPEATIENYEQLVQGLELPDPNDRHVLAVAIHAGAQLIVTENQGDFPPDTLAPYGIETLTADDFLVSTFELYPSDAIAALRIMRREYRNPKVNPSELLLHLQRNGLINLAVLVKPNIDAI